MPFKRLSRDRHLFSILILGQMNYTKYLFNLLPCREYKPVSYTHLDVYKRQGIASIASM